MALSISYERISLTQNLKLLLLLRFNSCLILALNTRNLEIVLHLHSNYTNTVFYVERFARLLETITYVSSTSTFSKLG